MKKCKRYQLTEGQLKTVIKVIPENYPAGVTDSNFDSLSGADRDSYDYISDVKLNKDGDLVFTVETQNGQTVIKNLWVGDDAVILPIERELPKYGYNVEQKPEWNIENVTINNHYVIFDISDYGSQRVRVPIDMASVIEWLPDIDREEEHSYQYGEPNYDAGVDNY
jgi:hypothetical protein